MNKLSLIIVLILSSQVGYGQISTREEPASFRTNVPAFMTNERTQKVTPSLDFERLDREDRENEANGLPFRFGYKHEVDYTLENSGEWTELPDGGNLWRLEISCPGAFSINLTYNSFWLPDSAKLWIYSADRSSSIGAFTSANNKGNGRDDMQGFATGLVYSDRVVLEYYLPQDADETGVISIDGIVHGYRNATLPKEPGVFFIFFVF